MENDEWLLSCHDVRTSVSDSPMKTRRILPSRGEWLVIAGISAILFFVLYPAVQRARNPLGPHGEMIPSEPPEESRRFVHSSGTSIIVPVNWDVVHQREAPYEMFQIACRGVPGARLKSAVMLQRWGSPEASDLVGFSACQFQQHPAHECMQILRRGGFADPPLSHYDLYVNCDGQWWYLTVLVADELATLPDEIRAYIETIRFPESNGIASDGAEE